VCSSDLGEGARQFVLEILRGAGVAMKQAVAIRIGGGGNPVALDQVAEEQKVPVRVFLGAKDAGQDGAGGIIDRGVEDEARAALLEPGMMAAVHLDEQTGLRHALAAATVPRGTPGTGTADPCSA